ncbi:unnamed protein product [Darwinula stevensoni]|uniref:Peptidase metallopeptidase domain-containing protein n=1 Tax=Darwinula stevensoni TaxID=69355 RepID=A0A7R9A4S5_9CRUS|nr:unnamed protein product [Darwinula stevensoni]CAG0883961.1 unnamed protein product [Darwinula stevensoni]
MQPLVLSNFLPILLICTWPHPSAGKIQLRSPRGAADDTTSLLYLQKFGYLAPTSGNSLPLIDGSALRSAVKEFQEFAGLTATGDLDQETLDTMALPRCGVKDKVGKGVNARRKRYALQGSRWRVRDLNYTISQYPSSTLSKSDVDKEVQRAFQIWSDVTDLNFRHVEGGKVHIDIRFAEGEHGDGDPFDGPGGTLAHAFFPIYGGDAHFDDKEQWTIDSYRGTNFFQVAAHEFGHSLGLSHSEVRSALMAPFYRGFEPNFKLNSDDISAIQGLYGDGKGKGQKDQVDKPVTAPSVEDPDLCNNPEVDLVVTIGKETFAFKGDKYWQLTETAVAPGYPKKISDDWPGLPNDIDTAFTWTNGKTYFFKGSEYWRYTGREADKDYPKKISEGFEGIPDNIDAAFVWSGNGQIYFFKGRNKK